MAQWIKNGNGSVVLLLSPAEAGGLLALVGEGREGLFSDEESAKAYIGNRAAQDAAKRAADALGAAWAAARNTQGSN